MSREKAPDGLGMSLGSYLRMLRVQRGLTQRQIEARSGVSNPYISQLEQNRGARPSARILQALADCYDVDWLELMRLAGHPVPPQLDGEGQPTVTFVGAEQLSFEERADVQAFITYLLRRRERPRQQDEPVRGAAPA